MAARLVLPQYGIEDDTGGWWLATPRQTTAITAFLKASDECDYRGQRMGVVKVRNMFGTPGQGGQHRNGETCQIQDRGKWRCVGKVSIN
jgi:hypothetical protein